MGSAPELQKLAPGAHGAPWGGPWGPRFFCASPARPPELAQKNPAKKKSGGGRAARMPEGGRAVSYAGGPGAQGAKNTGFKGAGPEAL